MNKIFVDLIGCFKDSNKRVLEGGRTWNNHMTVSQCRKRCEKENSKFYGLEVKAKRGISYHTTLYINFKKKTQGKHCFRVYILFFLQAGHECFCGNSMRSKIQKPISECRRKCKGSREACGGGWRILIYRNRKFRKTRESFVCLILVYKLFSGNDFEVILNSLITRYFNLQLLSPKQVSNTEIYFKFKILSLPNYDVYRSGIFLQSILSNYQINYFLYFRSKNIN